MLPQSRYVPNIHAILKPIGISANHEAYIKNDARATNPDILLIHGRNFPFFPGLLLSTICPMVTSVNASTIRATIIIIPTSFTSTPITSE